MPQTNERTLWSVLLALTVVALTPVAANAQQGDRYIVVPYEVVEEVPFTEDVWVVEDSFEIQKQTVQRAVWNTETRQRRVVTQKPVKETRERLERKTFYRPEEVTRYRDKEITETTYRKVTKFRTEEVVVKKPVIETEYRNETRVVKKPVTESMIEVKKTTSYKPITEKRTEWVARPGGVGLVVQADRPRLRYLQPGYYTDPATGLSVYRRRGLHWTSPNSVGVADLPPTLVPEERTETRFVPETNEVRRPVELTRTVETTETYKVPVKVERMVDTVETRRVPYTVEEPVTTRRTIQVPYTETIMREEVVTEKVPYTETVMKDVVTYEPYEVKVGKYVDDVVDVKVPTKKRRKVTRESTRLEKRIINMKILVDSEGNYLSEPQPLTKDDLVEGQLVRINKVADQAPSIIPQGKSVGEGTTQERKPIETLYRGRATVRRVPYSVLMPPKDAAAGNMTPIEGRQQSVIDRDQDDTTPSEVTPANPPEVEPSNETGNEGAADTTPVNKST